MNCLWKAVQDITGFRDELMTEALGPCDLEVHLDYAIDMLVYYGHKPCVINYDPYGETRNGDMFRAYDDPESRLDKYHEPRIYFNETHASVNRSEVPEPITVMVFL